MLAIPRYNVVNDINLHRKIDLFPDQSDIFRKSAARINPNKDDLREYWSIFILITFLPSSGHSSSPKLGRTKSTHLPSHTQRSA